MSSAQIQAQNSCACSNPYSRMPIYSQDISNQTREQSSVRRVGGSLTRRPQLNSNWIESLENRSASRLLCGYSSV